MSMLAFFPWLEVSEPVTAGEFELLPFRRGVAPSGRGTTDQAIYDRLLAPYHSGGAPIGHATLARIAGDDLTRDRSDDERGALFVFSELLSMSGLAARDFFGLGLTYHNRDNFRLVVQGFSDDRGGAAITTRRRDGSTLNFWPGDDYRVQKPEHVSLGRSLLDLELLKALLDSRESENWNSLYEAILSFNLSNTDSSDVSEHIEAVLLVGAFERLLGCHRGKEDDLVGRFVTILTPTENKQPGAVTFLGTSARRFRNSPTVRDMWIRDFFRLRGNLAHGKIQSLYQPVWGLRNHLLLGSFVFPLVLKLVLRAAGAYGLSLTDQEAIDMFEEQACHDHFAPVADRNDSRSHPWNRVREEAVHRRLERSLAAELSRHFKESDDVSGSEGG